MSEIQMEDEKNHALSCLSNGLILEIILKHILKFKNIETLLNFSSINKTIRKFVVSYPLFFPKYIRTKNMENYITFNNWYFHILLLSSHDVDKILFHIKRDSNQYYGLIIGDKLRKNINDEVFKNIFNKFKNIKNLDISNCKNITTTKYFCNLKKIIAYDCNFSDVSYLNNLESVSLEECYYVEDISSFTNVKYVRVRTKGMPLKNIGNLNNTKVLDVSFIPHLNLYRHIDKFSISAYAGTPNSNFYSSSDLNHFFEFI